MTESRAARIGNAPADEPRGVTIDAGPDTEWLADIGTERYATLCGLAASCHALDSSDSIECDYLLSDCK